MYLLDDYLKAHGVTRYKLSQISGIGESTLASYKKKELKEFPVYLLEGIGMLIGKKSWEVLEDLKMLENQDDLNGFGTLLKKYNISYPELEIKLAALIDALADRGVGIEPFTFNRFENGEHTEDVQADIKKMLENAIVMLEGVLEETEEN